jgi:hypothetical protein
VLIAVAARAIRGERPRAEWPARSSVPPALP